MKKLKVLTLILFLNGCLGISTYAQAPVQRVIFMIGDGMGLSQIYAAATVKGMKLTLFEAPYVGLSLTYSANRYITDSAAGGTALATGHKTNNGVIGLDSDSAQVASIMEVAKEHGFATGLVVTVPITHATPAAFYAHNINRKNQEEIAVDLLYSQVDCFIGGGRHFLENRKDKANISDSLRLKGYEVVYTLDELSRSKGKKSGALLASIDMEPAAEREMLLPRMTQIALDKLSAISDSFFLMVEGSQIDYQGHNNDTPKLLAEMVEFDEAVAVALDFVEKNPGTLLVITADHETGGMVITDGDIEKGTVEASYFSDYHTGIPVPVFSFGTEAEKFAGVYQNTALYYKFMSLLGFLKF